MERAEMRPHLQKGVYLPSTTEGAQVVHEHLVYLRDRHRQVPVGKTTIAQDMDYLKLRVLFDGSVTKEEPDYDQRHLYVPRDPKLTECWSE